MPLGQTTCTATDAIAKMLDTFDLAIAKSA